MIPTHQIFSSLLLLLIAFVALTIQNQIGTRKGIWLTLTIFMTVTGIKVMYDHNESSRNFYSLLEVPRHSSALEIRKAYKKISLKLHPDKNPSADAKKQFDEVKEVYDILMEESKRDLYNRFGEENIDFDPRQDEIKLLSSVAVNYIFWGVISYIATIPTTGRAARIWISVIVIMVFAIEVFLCLTETTLPKALPPYLTEHEFILYLHSGLPAVIALLRLLADYLFVDVEKLTIDGLLEISKQQKSTVGPYATLYLIEHIFYFLKLYNYFGTNP